MSRAELADLVDRITDLLLEETVDVDLAVLKSAARGCVQFLLDEGALEVDE